MSLSQGSIASNCGRSSLHSHLLLRHFWVRVASRSRRKLSHLCWYQATEKGFLESSVTNSPSWIGCTWKPLIWTPCCKRWSTVSAWPPFTASRVSATLKFFNLVSIHLLRKTRIVSREYGFGFGYTKYDGVSVRALADASGQHQAWSHCYAAKVIWVIELP